jgi:hypothetical protein
MHPRIRIDLDLPRYQKEQPQRGLRIEAVLFLDAAGRLWHPLLRDHIPLPCAVAALLLHHAALATFSGPACSIARM